MPPDKAALIDRISREFGVDPSEPGLPSEELVSAIFDLVRLVYENRVRLFGDILIGLIRESDAPGYDFGSCISILREQLSLGRQFAADRYSLAGGDKVCGRDWVAFVNFMTSSQLKMLIEWMRWAGREVPNRPIEEAEEWGAIVVWLESVRA